MFYELYAQGIITLSTLLISLALLAVILVFSVILYRSRIFISMKYFSFAILLSAGVCFFLPPELWLKIAAVMIVFGFIQGILLCLFMKLSGIDGINLKYSHARIAFVGIDETLSAEVKIRRLFFLSKFFNYYIEGSDSCYLRIKPETKQFSYLPGKILTFIIDVSFALRGYDKDSNLFGYIALKYPYNLIFPWRKKAVFILPELAILSSSFAVFAGKKIPKSDDLNKLTPVRRLSKLRTESFLHLAKFSAGESLSQIDFRASMRSKEIISKKYSKSIDLRALTAIGFGRRVLSAGVPEEMLSIFGKMIAENFAKGIHTDAVLFDMACRQNYDLSTDPAKALRFGKDIASVQPTVHEEDEFCIPETIGRRIRDYTHFRLLTAWGGSFDCSRAIEVASMFVKNGADAEINIYAPEVFSILDKNADTKASVFFGKLMDEYSMKAKKCGVDVIWFS